MWPQSVAVQDEPITLPFVRARPSNYAVDARKDAAGLFRTVSLHRGCFSVSSNADVALQAQNAGDARLLMQVQLPTRLPFAAEPANDVAMAPGGGSTEGGASASNSKTDAYVTLLGMRGTGSHGCVCVRRNSTVGVAQIKPGRVGTVRVSV